MNDFDTLCFAAAKRFIRTVAVVDDEAAYAEEYPRPLLADAAANVISPAGMPTKSVVSRSSAEDPSLRSPPNPGEDTHRLDAGKVVDAFAEMDIVCCVQRPKKDDGRIVRAAKLAAASDIFIIDWDLDKSEKTLARDILSQVLRDDLETGGRARLFVVYTAQKNADQMLKDLAEDVQTTFGCKPRLEKDNFVVAHKHLRIVILNKEKTITPASGARIVSFQDLPNVVVHEFQQLVAGIIPIATMNVIAAMRERTHKLLAVLDKNLDGTYCHHRSLLKEPSESVEFAMHLIASEIQTVLQSDEEARACIDRNGVKAWFNNRFNELDSLSLGEDYAISPKDAWKIIDSGDLSEAGRRLRFKTLLAKSWVKAKTLKNATFRKRDGESLTQEQAAALVESGRHEDIRNCSPYGELRFVDALYESKQAAETACLQMAALQITTRDVERLHFSSEQTPTLQLGTIIRNAKNKDDCYLCLQPPCDSVRLAGVTTFLFVKLTEGKSGRSDLVIRVNDGGYLRLVLKAQNSKPEFATLRFSPRGQSDRVRARRYKGEFRFPDSRRVSFCWLAELRPEKAQQIANDTAANTARVGIDEFEWLRRQRSM